MIDSCILDRSIHFSVFYVLLLVPHIETHVQGGPARLERVGLCLWQVVQRGLDEVGQKGHTVCQGYDAFRLRALLCGCREGAEGVFEDQGRVCAGEGGCRSVCVFQQMFHSVSERGLQTGSRAGRRVWIR